MTDAGRPVTGYPAQNPHPSNGFTANHPPPGVSYPYAAPPPSGVYYRYQNYPEGYQYDSNYDRRLVFTRCIFTLVIGAFLILGTVTFIVWLVLRPQLPVFQVDSFSVSNFSLGNTSLISFTSTVRLTATNPNKKMSLEYDQIEAFIYYDSQALSQTIVPPFSQETRNVTSVTANFAAAGSFVAGSVVDAINSTRRSNGNVKFNLRVLSTVSFDAKAWRTRRRYLKVICVDLTVGLLNNVTSGSLIGGPKPCRVGI